MPQVRLNGDQFLLSPDPNSISGGYFVDLTTNLDQFREAKEFTDVTIWCNNGHLSAHKLMVASQSKLLSMFFQENPMSSDILCPDFSTEMMAGFLNLLYSGLAITSENADLHQINAIIKSLGANIELSGHSMDQLDLKIIPLEPSSHDDADDFSDESLSDLDEMCLQAEEKIRQPEKSFEGSTSPDSAEMKKHQGVAPALVCPECNKAFFMQIALNKHRQRFHQANISSSVQKPSEDKENLTIECLECKESVSRASLNHHSKICRKPDPLPESKAFANYYIGFY